MSICLDILSNLACIDCGGNIEYIENPEHLACKKCGKEYLVIDGIPMMGGIDDRTKDSEVNN